MCASSCGGVSVRLFVDVVLVLSAAASVTGASGLIGSSDLRISTLLSLASVPLLGASL